jgi:hypothetical protein
MRGSRRAAGLRRFHAGLGIGVALVAGVACSPGGTAATNHDVRASIVTPGDFKNGWAASPKDVICIATPDYVHVFNSQATLVDESGTILAVAKVDSARPATLGESVPFACAFVAAFTQVPEAKFYSLKVSGVTGPAIALEDLKTRAWSMPTLDFR